MQRTNFPYKKNYRAQQGRLKTVCFSTDCNYQHFEEKILDIELFNEMKSLNIFKLVLLSGCAVKIGLIGHPNLQRVGHKRHVTGRKWHRTARIHRKHFFLKSGQPCIGWVAFQHKFDCVRDQ